jgi:MFS family permease
MSFGVSTGLVAVLSVIAELILCARVRRGGRFVGAVLIPPVVSTALYWLPNLSRVHDGEYRTWFFLFLIFWSAAGVGACMIAAGILTFVEHREKKRLALDAREQQRII